MSWSVSSAVPPSSSVAGRRWIAFSTLRRPSSVRRAFRADSSEGGQAGAVLRRRVLPAVPGQGGSSLRLAGTQSRPSHTGLRCPTGWLRRRHASLEETLGKLFSLRARMVLRDAPLLHAFVIQEAILPVFQEEGRRFYAYCRSTMTQVLFSYRDEIRHPEPELAAEMVCRTWLALMEQVVLYGASPFESTSRSGNTATLVDEYTGRWPHISEETAALDVRRREFRISAGLIHRTRSAHRGRPSSRLLTCAPQGSSSPFLPMIAGGIGGSSSRPEGPVPHLTFGRRTRPAAGHEHRLASPRFGRETSLGPTRGTARVEKFAPQVHRGCGHPSSAFVVRLWGIELPPYESLAIYGIAVVGAAVLLAWAAETAQLDISGSLAIALLALIAVLPEYAADLYFAYTAGHEPEYAQYAAANMTGSNRLLLGLGWRWWHSSPVSACACTDVETRRGARRRRQGRSSGQAAEGWGDWRTDRDRRVAASGSARIELTFSASPLSTPSSSRSSTRSTSSMASYSSSSTAATCGGSPVRSGKNLS